MIDNTPIVFMPATPTLKWTDPNLPPEYWWIELGPFFDRFKDKAMAVMTSQDIQVKAAIALAMPRKYIDLKRPDVLMFLSLFASLGLITEAEKNHILTTPTTEYERFVKNLPQPV